MLCHRSYQNVSILFTNCIKNTLFLLSHLPTLKIIEIQITKALKDIELTVITKNTL